jgi:uncharacterized protein YcaQ
MISLAQARALHLAAQGLLQPAPKAASRVALRKAVARMQLLQIDTIHVVARSPYLVLFSRLGHYPRNWLDDALAHGEVFETWAHEACFAPTDDLLLHRAYNRHARTHWGLIKAEKSHTQQRAHLDQLLTHIRDHGAVKSSDFERTEGQGGAWWGWKDEKRWLEALFATGELMVARRENFHRVYDLTQRVAPQALALEAQGQAPDAGWVGRQFIEKSVVALGICQARWVNDYFRMKPRLKDADLDALVEDGTLSRVAVEGWDAPGYVHHSNQSLLNKAAKGALLPTHCALLSPFDPVVWDRERAVTFFDFDYRLECYTPEAKRIHGYFVLPILCRGEMIGRLDAKAHRSDGIFEVKALYAQPLTRWTPAQVQDVAHAIVRCAVWHDTPTVRITRTQPAGLRTALLGAIREMQRQVLAP